MTLTQTPSPPLQAIHRKAQHPPCSTCFFDLWQLTVRSGAVSDPGSSALPRTTVAACKKNRTEIFVRRFSTSQLTDRSGATQEEQPNAPRHPLAKKSDGVGWSSFLSAATYRQVRCHARRTTPQLFCDRRTDTRGPRPEQSRAKQKHEPRRKRKVIRGHTRDDTPHCTERQVLEMG